MKFAAYLLLVLFAAGCASSPMPAAPAAPVFDGSVSSEQQARFNPVVGTKGMVAADDETAAEWGVEILRRGGNAVDAAVATAYMLSVTRPHYGSLGGGGFMVYCPKGKPCRAIDFREMAPRAASRDMYLRNGKADTRLSQDGPLAPGVPGIAAGLSLALDQFGTRKLPELLKRPIEVAKKGFRFTGYMESLAEIRWDAFNDEARRIFGCGNKVCPPGTLIRQPDLARVLEEISRHGAAAFYNGWIADKISKGIRDAGGIMTSDDLAGYEAKFRDPVRGTFHGMEVVSMPPPSSGGVIVIQMLQYMERAERQGALAEGYGSASATHAIAHAMSLAFADRAEFLGDPDHVKVPLSGLLEPSYLDDRWKSFVPDRAVPPKSAGKPHQEPMHTTHFSAVDREGNAVAITVTVNNYYGSGFVPPGTGIVMNDQMDDFSAQPGVPNLFGLVGAEANAIAPKKRPLSSMSPTIVRDAQGNARILIGAEGGPQIPTSVFLSLVNRLEFGMALTDAVDAPRIHEQWKPDILYMERAGFSEEVRNRLRLMGYHLELIPKIGKIHAIERFPNGRVWGMPDPRGEGAAVAE